MEKKIAGLIITPMWRAFMDAALKDTPAEDFKKPAYEDLSSDPPVIRGVWQGNKTYFVDKMSGELATDFTPPDLRVEKAVPDVHSILYWIDKDNPTGGRPANPNDDPQFSHWEYAVQKWAAEQGIVSGGSVPTAVDSVHTPESAPKVSIVTPTANASYAAGDRTLISISHSGAFPLARVDYFLNDAYLGSSASDPFSFSFVPKDTQYTEGINTLKAVAYDSAQNKSEASVSITIKGQ